MNPTNRRPTLPNLQTMPSAYHQQITNAFRARRAYGRWVWPAAWGPAMRANGGPEQDFLFQEQERQREKVGVGNLGVDMFKYRVSDPAIGRFWQIDPLAEEYYHYGPYNFSGNRLIDATELEGLEPQLVRWAMEFFDIKSVSGNVTLGPQAGVKTGKALDLDVQVGTVEVVSGSIDRDVETGELDTQAKLGATDEDSGTVDLTFGIEGSFAGLNGSIKHEVETSPRDDFEGTGKSETTTTSGANGNYNSTTRDQHGEVVDQKSGTSTAVGVKLGLVGFEIEIEFEEENINRAGQ